MPTYGNAQSFSFRKFTVEDGLPSSYLYDIAQDQEGYIWVATEGGICKYDGLNFIKNPIPELGAEEAINILFDSKERMWMGLINTQVVYYENENLYRFNPSDFMYKGESIIKRIVDINEDNQGKIWIVSKEGPVVRLDSIHQGKIIKKKIFPLPYYSAILMSKIEGSKFFFGRDGIHKIKNDSTQYQAYDKNIPNHTPFYSVAKGKNIYYNSRSHIFSYNSETKEHSVFLDEYSKFYQKGINTITLDKKNNFWINSKDGILFLSPKKNGNYSTQHLLKNNFVGHTFQDRDDNFWITTQKNGLFFIPSTQIKVLDQSNGLSTNLVTALENSKGNRIIAGFDNNSFNILSIQNDARPKVHLKDRLTDLNLEIYDILSPNKDEIYFYSSGGLYIRNHSLSKSKISNPIRNSLKTGKIANDGSHWIGSSGSTFIIKNNIISETILRERTYAIHPVNQHESWIGTVNGLYYYTKEKGTKKTNIDELKNVDIRSLEMSKKNELWVGTKAIGIYILKNKKVIKHLTIKDGLPSNSCTNIFLDRHFAWIGTNNGIAKISLKDFSISNIDVNMGLPSREINDIIKKDSIIIAATNGGIAYFPENIISQHRKPSVLITNVRINEKDTVISESYILPYDENNIKLSFSGIAYQSSKDLIYNIKMEGLDQDWLPSETGKAEYPSLAPGEYNLLIKAKTLNSDWSDITSIYFYVSTPFWKRVWFIVLMVLLFLLSTLLLTYLYIENSKKRDAFQTRLRESRLTALRSQMNPHFMFNSLNSIQEFIFLNDKKSANKYLARFSKLMRIILDMSDMNVIPLEKEIEALELYLELENMRFDGELQYKITTQKELNIDSFNLPSMLIQPYVENAIKHGLMHKSENRKLNIHFSFKNQDLICEVDDNGIGRNAARLLNSHKSNKHKPKAMSLNQERLSLLNYAKKDELNLEIIDKEDSIGNPTGTKVIIYIRQKKSIKNYN